jgi:hypothetical protein
MRMQGWRISLKAITLIGGFLMLPLGAFNPATAQEPDVDISVVYGWWQVVTRPEKRLYIAENRVYSEWDNNTSTPFKVDWIFSEGHFKRLGKNRFLFTAIRVLNHPQDVPLSNDCPFKEFTLFPSDLALPPKRMEIMVEHYEFYDMDKGLSGSCGGLPAYWPDWRVRRKLAKQK